MRISDHPRNAGFVLLDIDEEEEDPIEAELRKANYVADRQDHLRKMLEEARGRLAES
jgi:hypothetical protein